MFDLRAKSGMQGQFHFCNAEKSVLNSVRLQGASR